MSITENLKQLKNTLPKDVIFGRCFQIQTHC
ncbi:hypothetical protein CCAN11_1950023 [Capnocytophaga canimorsus]|uniref:Uncharacterized protein n=1 Tax=Capnocytophaga canimorsus TaxID=28188 RepID=A0A0B7IHR2_9FLAO|nr:hypothetical protein CCAN11_1950023 [Capnocytophaga canimorsus]